MSIFLESTVCLLTVNGPSQCLIFRRGSLVFANMDDGCCRRAFKCCAVPRYRAVLAAVTTVLFITFIIADSTGGDLESCGSHSPDEQCYKDLELCGSRRCACESSLVLTPYCVNRDVELFGWAMLCCYGGIFFMILSIVSCCYVGCYTNEPGVHVGIPGYQQVVEIEKL